VNREICEQDEQQIHDSMICEDTCWARHYQQQQYFTRLRSRHAQTATWQCVALETLSIATTCYHRILGENARDDDELFRTSGHTLPAIKMISQRLLQLGYVYAFGLNIS
jgi:hypothetical protein